MGIPKPLVKFNQLFIVFTVTTGIFIPSMLILPFIIGLITVITKRNPIILMTKPLLRKQTNEYILEDRDQQLFNQWIATILIGLSILFYSLGYSTASIVLNLMVILAAGIALLGFCVGCFIRFRYIMWKQKRKSV
ncbi:DUF4395 domain-containing protein [Salirhabdus salicampi]|uniref:DUF4395 domain-containing protein n=1 Tax=Salirhabdus salicampi TaxID=476102 RepID=UPI0020C54BFD|nr:DUF4395 domain-containing protein [Salirhabdus salicampi]MCP8615981.1 DUF4395 domain-containing protein [Salirhabdus salicampi]